MEQPNYIEWSFDILRQKEATTNSKSFLKLMKCKDHSFPTSILVVARFLKVSTLVCFLCQSFTFKWIITRIFCATQFIRNNEVERTVEYKRYHEVGYIALIVLMMKKLKV